jgi:hypothetical protein
VLPGFVVIEDRDAAVAALRDVVGETGDGDASEPGHDEGGAWKRAGGG